MTLLGFSECPEDVLCELLGVFQSAVSRHSLPDIEEFHPLHSSLILAMDWGALCKISGAGSLPHAFSCSFSVLNFTLCLSDSVIYCPCCEPPPCTTFLTVSHKEKVRAIIRLFIFFFPFSQNDYRSVLPVVQYLKMLFSIFFLGSNYFTMVRNRISSIKYFKVILTVLQMWLRTIPTMSQPHLITNKDLGKRNISSGLL